MPKLRKRKQPCSKCAHPTEYVDRLCQKCRPNKKRTVITVPNQVSSSSQASALRKQLRAQLDAVNESEKALYTNLEWGELNEEDSRRFRCVASYAEDIIKDNGTDIAQKKKELLDPILDKYGLNRVFIETRKRFPTSDAPQGSESDCVLLVGNMDELMKFVSQNDELDQILYQVDQVKALGVTEISLNVSHYGKNSLDRDDFRPVAKFLFRGTKRDRERLRLNSDKVADVYEIVGELEQTVYDFNQDISQQFADQYVGWLESDEVQAECWKKTRLDAPTGY